MLKTLSALFFILMMLVPHPAKAQGNITLPDAQVDLWPEYDKPEVLVINRYTLPASVSLPADFTFRIPASVGGPAAVAGRTPDGKLINLTYNSTVNGAWEEIKLKATTPEVQIEYYDPTLQKNSTARHYEYQWPGDYAVEAMNIVVQQPKGATGMRISPNLGNGVQADDGLTYFRANEGALTKGQGFNITLDYDKSSDALSASSMPVAPKEPITDNTTGRTTWAAILPWVLGGLGVLLIAGGIVWYWQSGRQRSSTPRRGRHKPSVASQPAAGEATYDPVKTAAPADGKFIYCHQCGKRAGPSDRFCRACGTPLRSN